MSVRRPAFWTPPSCSDTLVLPAGAAQDVLLLGGQALQSLAGDLLEDLVHLLAVAAAEGTTIAGPGPALITLAAALAAADGLQAHARPPAQECLAQLLQARGLIAATTGAVAAGAVASRSVAASRPGAASADG